jgi:hypothetical protein
VAATWQRQLWQFATVMFANPHHIMIEIHKRSSYIYGGEIKNLKQSCKSNNKPFEWLTSPPINLPMKQHTKTMVRSMTNSAIEFVDGFAIHLGTRTVQ